MASSPWGQKSHNNTRQNDPPASDVDWTPTPMGSGDDDSPLWKASNHEGDWHLAICDGETAEMESDYGTTTCALVRHMIVFDDGGQVTRYDDVLVPQQVLRQSLMQPGIRFGQLVKPDRAWLWAEASEDAFKYVVNDWLPANSRTGADGRPEITFVNP